MLPWHHGDNQPLIGQYIVPANLPPAYFEAEKRYREAKTPAEGIAALEEMLAIMPKHKGTDKLKADLRRRLSKLRSKQHEKKKVGKKESSFKIEREGVGQVVVIGAPNVGKSSLVTALTNADPVVADFPHSTWKPTPGMMYFEDIQIQLIDTPPISREYMEPLFFDMVRRSDVGLVLVDVHTDPLRELEETLSVLKERKIVPGGLERLSEDRAGWTYLPLLVIANKIDDQPSEENFEIFQSLLEDNWPVIPISARAGRNLDVLRESIFHALYIIRVYTKVPGKEPDLTEPFVLKKGSTLGELALKIHKDFAAKLKFARLWGAQVYDGQMVQRDHMLQDGDIVEFHV
jgi:ribosome-interacting GTPase 1